MSGFDNEVVFATNVDFSGSASVSGQITSDGQLLIGRTAVNAGGTHIDVGTLTAGTGISITNGAGSITITNTASGSVVWIDQTTSASVVMGNGYMADSASLVVMTLPVTCAFGTVFEVCAYNTGLWKIAQNTGQQIRLGDTLTTSGTGGYLQATSQGDCVKVLCTVANTSFLVLSSMGNITIA